jgi:hypothetical protein
MVHAPLRWLLDHLPGNRHAHHLLLVAANLVLPTSLSLPGPVEPPPGEQHEKQQAAEPTNVQGLSPLR